MFVPGSVQSLKRNRAPSLWSNRERSRAWRFCLFLDIGCNPLQFAALLFGFHSELSKMDSLVTDASSIFLLVSKYFWGRRLAKKEERQIGEVELHDFRSSLGGLVLWAFEILGTLLNHSHRLLTCGADVWNWQVESRHWPVPSIFPKGSMGGIP